jgi:bifunctional non-homologous end joining protein LigD
VTVTTYYATPHSRARRRSRPPAAGTPCAPPTAPSVERMLEHTLTWTAEATDDGACSSSTGTARSSRNGLRIDAQAAHSQAGPAYARRVLPAGRFIAPMLLTPTTAVPDDSAWALEPKLDGCRGQVRVAGGRVQVRSRPGRDCTEQFPELAAIATQVTGHDVVLDGELVSLDRHGRPDFEQLRRRLALGRPAALAAAARTPVAFVAFDLLEIDGRNFCPQPYRERRAYLQALELRDGPAITVPSYDAGREDLATATRALQLEGVVAKRLDSRYLPGRRSRAWLKHKHWRSENLIVTGWRPGTRHAPDTVFLARLASDGTLTHAGQAAYGIDGPRKALIDAVRGRDRRAPARGIRAVRPVIAVRVDHHGRVGEGPLRDPIIRDYAVLGQLDERAAGQRSNA